MPKSGVAARFFDDGAEIGAFQVCVAYKFGNAFFGQMSSNSSKHPCYGEKFKHMFQAKEWCDQRAQSHAMQKIKLMNEARDIWRAEKTLERNEKLRAMRAPRDFAEKIRSVSF